MELQTHLKSIADKITQLRDKIKTEESTKHAFILPFINALGYDTFDPTEVVPEFTADLGLKKGEKVDYAIFQNQVPILIIECKHWEENLDNHNSQLLRYFHTTKTRFALLTNGVEYKFYTDLEHSNKMDEKPFLEFNITTIKDGDITEVAKFHKSKFDAEKIITNASSLKYTKEIKKHISNEMKNPTSEFIRLFANRVYSGRLTERVMQEFSELVHKAFNQTVSEKVSDRLNAALHKEEEKQQEEIVEEKPEESKVVTTEEELEAFRIVVAILRRKISIERITHRDTQSYFGVLLDDNNRKPLCRLHFNGKKKYLGILDENKKESKELIEQVEDIYRFEEKLLMTLGYYMEEHEA